jgi:hypothetical protein
MAEQTSPSARGPRGSGTKSAPAKSAPAKSAPTERAPAKSAAPQGNKSTKTAPRKKARRSEIVATVIDPDRRRALIAQAAYFRAERRHFAPGYENEDWLAAESEVDTALTLGVASSDS